MGKGGREEGIWDSLQELSGWKGPRGGIWVVCEARRELELGC